MVRSHGRRGGGGGEVDEVTVTDSITDPGGVTHTAALAAQSALYSDEQAQDALDALLSAGDKLTYTYDDANDTLTLNTLALDTEEVEDAVNSLLSGGTNVTTTYDDANDTLTLDTSGLNTEQVQDEINNVVAGGSNITTTYDDGNGTLTLDTSALNTEEVEDAVDSLLSAGTNLSYTYDDANDTLTIGTTDNPTFSTLTASSLVNSGDGETWETLHSAGFDGNQFIPFYTVGTGGTASTTSSNYTAVHTADLNPAPIWNTLAPGSGNFKVGLQGEFDPNGDSIDVRLYNTTDSEEVVSTTATVAANQQIIPSQYTPTTTSSGVKIQCEIRNSDGATSVSLNNPTIIIGVEP